MTGIQDPRTPFRDDSRLLSWELACVSGTLSEIMTTWRRARPFRPDLQFGWLTWLQDTVRRLAAETEAAADAGLQPPPDLARFVAGRFSALEEGIASARAVTCGPGVPEVGDDRLWESLGRALRKAGAQLTDLMPAE